MLSAALLLPACAQMRPSALPPPGGCVVPGWKLLPSRFDPKLTVPALKAFVLTDAQPETFSEMLAARMKARDQLRGPTMRRVLVISGGSQHGAFGAGFFRGLQASQGIPDYDIVTAVSTGALQSTMVFLANRPVPADRTNYPAYMRVDRGLGKPGTSNVGDLALGYAIGREGDLMKVGSLSLGSAVFNGSLATFKPLREMVGDLITPETIRAVAREAAAHRSLLVGVTNLDDGYGYAVDMTELATQAVASGDLERYRRCYIETLLASSTVPPGVPPITLSIDRAGGRPQMYMDGGARFGVFFDQLRDLVDSGSPADTTLIVNGGIYGSPWLDKKGRRIEKWSVVSFGLRAVDLMENQVYRLSIDDVERWASANGTLHMAFNSEEGLTSMTMRPDDWLYPASGLTCRQASDAEEKASAPQEFHAAYMRCLIDYGQHRGSGDPWNKILPPPGP